MRKKVIKKKTEMSSTAKNVTGIVLSSVIGVIITLIISLFFSYIFTNSQTITDSVKAFFIGSVLLGAFFCGLLSARITSFKGIVSGAISSIIFALIITVIMLFFANGRLSANTLFLYIGVIIIGLIGGICGANIKRRK